MLWKRRRLRGCARFSSIYSDILPHLFQNCKRFFKNNFSFCRLCWFWRFFSSIRPRKPTKQRKKTKSFPQKSPKTKKYKNIAIKMEKYCEKPLTNDRKGDKIVNCIIIAWLWELFGIADKLSDSNLHKNRLPRRGLSSGQAILWMEWLNQWST